MAIDVNPITQTDSIIISTDASANLDDTIEYAQQALASAQASALSASQSSTYATNSSNSASTSESQAIIATTQANNALTSANNADTSEANAETYMNSASTYATNSYNSSVSSATSASNAGISETNTLSYSNSAGNSATTATTKAGEASISASNASTSESNALSYKNTTQGYMNTTEGYKNNASTSASNALDSENKANQWANEDKDVEVETGLYSAKHWAITMSEGLIDDNTVSTLKAYSSSKIESKLATKSDKVFTNTDTAGAGILVGNNVVEWTKGFTIFTGAILIELTGLYDEASMVGRMKIVINQAVGDDRVIYVDGRWLSTTHIWDEANVIEVSTALTKLNVRFARDVVNSKVYLVIGETSSSWNALRIAIDEVLTNYNSSLNLGFVIASTTDISGLTVDYTKIDIQDSNTDDYLGSLITGVLI